MPCSSASHYVVLGVPRDADAARIRAAFRALAREHHPDRAGPEATARFQRMVEAYDVLTDPERRRAYDGACRGAEAPSPGPSPPPARSARTPGAVVPDPPRRPAVEPLDDLLPASARVSQVSSTRSRGPAAVLPLTWWEARQGGTVEVAIPLLERCERCDGAGVAPPGICSSCGGSGRVTGAWSLTLALPPGLRTGDRLTRLVRFPGGTVRELTLLVRVL